MKGTDQSRFRSIHSFSEDVMKKIMIVLVFFLVMVTQMERREVQKGRSAEFLEGLAVLLS